MPKIKTAFRFYQGLVKSYFRVKVEGLENIPKKGGCIVLPNHSGFAGTDGLLITYVIKRGTRRRPRVMVNRAFFDFSVNLKRLSERLGLKKASVQEGVQVLKRGQIMILFPEGESGNFKSTFRRYHLAEFHTGFLRMAIEARVPIVPCIVIGAEESHLNLGSINLSRWTKNVRIPLPINFIPLPAKWKMLFLTPIDVSRLNPSILNQPERLKREAAKIRAKIQKQIDAELKERPYIYFRETKKMVDYVKAKFH